MGVDATHVDLASAVVDKYDGVEDDAFQQPNPWDSHGTACAGLAVAVHDNDTGMKGVAGGCSLMAARIAESKTPGNWKTSDSWIARGIDWAWKNGADVLSNSWTTAESSAITNALERARTKGRNGRGCVVVVAAGNSDGPCGYPASLEDVLTVSASNQFDEPKTPDSRDGDTKWGSSFGPRVDVAAPGILNFTTDIMGEAGFNPAPPPAGNYNPRLKGTSSSAPIVAGAAALVLSANPDLTESEVSALIRNTADKVGGIAYDDGRNDRMGHGRINVLRAVRAAQEGRIDGEPVEEPVEEPDEEPVVEPVDEPTEEPVEGPIEIPTGRHAPVSNIDGDREREATVLLTDPSNKGEAPSELQKTRKGAEWLPSVNPPTVPDTFQAPDTSGLRNIAEASYGPPAPAGESIRVPDRRVKIDGIDGHPWRAHASLVITARDGSRWLGTGWFVGPRTLVTAGHTVYVKNSAVPALDGWVSRIDVMAGRNGSELPFGAVRSEVFHTVAGWAEDGDHRYDYGAITIPTELGETVGTLGFGVFNSDDLYRVIGNIAGYSSDKPDGPQWYENNRVEYVSARKVYYDMDLVGDLSGSAVYRIDAGGRRKAFGVHAYGGRRNNAAIRITVPVYHNFRHWMQAYG